MKKLKKRKFALATAVATLTASLSMFSGVPAFAENALTSGLVVFNVTDSSVLVGSPNYTETEKTRRDLGFDFYSISKEELVPIAEQVKYGDIIYIPGNVFWGSTCTPLINDMVFDLEGETPEIAGSVLEESFKNISSVTVDDQTSIQITGTDGTQYVFEDGITYKEMENFLGWEYGGSYSGLNLNSDTAEYSEEMANKYSKESGQPIWVIPGQNVEYYFEIQKGIFDMIYNATPVVPAGTWYSHKMVVVDMMDDAVYVAWDGEAPENDKRDMTYHFYKLDKSIPEMAEIADELKYGDIIRYTGTGEMVFAGNPLIDDMSFTSGEGKLEILGSVVTAPVQGNFTAVTDKDNVTYILMNDADYDTCYMIESRADHNTITDFLTWVSEDHTGDSKPHKFDWKKDGAFWIRPNEDGDVNSDNEVNSADAAVILEDVAMSAVGDTGRMNASENQAADVNGDGAINAADAAIVLSYSSEVGSGMLEGVTLKAYAVQ
ncbi:MAG: dockerin type I repeat-containing protein [Oscillospiraceae bacterium]|nr:dockerin type I repeat-containing protein [Oscillospiraceae bacterium]